MAPNVDESCYMMEAHLMPPAAERGVVEPPDGPRTVRRWWNARWVVPAALTAGYVLNVLFRLSLVTRQDFPTVNPDEEMYLVMARILAGLPTTEIPGNQIIPSGYSLLVSPALRITQDPVYAYHLVMGINALISCLVLPAAYWALRRLRVPRPVAYAAATAAVLLPPVVFYAQYAMADTVLPLLVLLWLIGMHGLFSEGDRARRIRFGLLGAFAAGYSLLTHDRGGVIMALTGVVLLVALVRAWAPRAAAAAALAVLAVMFCVKQVMTAWLMARIDGARPSAVANAVFQSLEDTALLRRTVMRITGHLWYFMTSTWGLGALALVVCVYVVLRRRFALADRVTAFLAVALLFGIALAGAAGLPADGRIDTIAYARYLSPLAAVYVLVAVAALYHLRSRRKILALGAAACGVTLALAAVLVHMAAGELRRSVFVSWGLPDASFLSSLWTAKDNWASFHAGRTTAVALAVLAAVLLLRLVGGGRRVALTCGAIGLALAVFAGFATVSITEHVTKPWISWRSGDATGFLQAAGIRRGDRLVMDAGLRWETRMAMSFEVLDGRVWTRELVKGQAAPEGATVAVLPFAGKGPAQDSWPAAAPGWHLDRDVRANGYVVWRSG
ncbi:hypothetical protein AB0N09_36250 [Streptomyces erythrochromogenes]|uniref:hypothetical protein n=1 Tax=Streptomyces erythrochromogenes TaxID=285574 RepID=UPI00342ACBCF